MHPCLGISFSGTVTADRYAIGRGGLYKSMGVFHKIFVKFIMVCFFIGYGRNGLIVKRVNPGIRAGHEKGGMGGDDKLGMACPVYSYQKIQQVNQGGGGQGCLGFIQKIEAFYSVPRSEIGHEGLAVRLGNQGFSAEMVKHGRIIDGPFFKVFRKMGENLGAEV